LPLFRIMLCPKSSGSEGLPVPQPRIGRGCMRQRESLIGVAWGARPKPGPASPANMSKQGLSARHYVPNQTLIMVNARLPKGNSAAGNQGNPGGYGGGTGFPRPTRSLPQCSLPLVREGGVAATVVRVACPSPQPSPTRGREPTVHAERSSDFKFHGADVRPRSRAHTSIRVQRRASGLPCAMVLRFPSRSPVIGLFCHRHFCRYFRKSLTPASRRQDHTT
jgi:hypothetical protein